MIPTSGEFGGLIHADGSRERAAQILGMSRVTLWRRMKALGLLDEAEPES